MNTAGFSSNGFFQNPVPLAWGQLLPLYLLHVPLSRHLLPWHHRDEQNKQRRIKGAIASKGVRTPVRNETAQCYFTRLKEAHGLVKGENRKRKGLEMYEHEIYPGTESTLLIVHSEILAVFCLISSSMPLQRTLWKGQALLLEAQLTFMEHITYTATFNHHSSPWKCYDPSFQMRRMRHRHMERTGQPPSWQG